MRARKLPRARDAALFRHARGHGLPNSCVWDVQDVIDQFDQNNPDYPLCPFGMRPFREEGAGESGAGAGIFCCGTGPCVPGIEGQNLDDEICEFDGNSGQRSRFPLCSETNGGYPPAGSAMCTQTFNAFGKGETPTYVRDSGLFCNYPFPSPVVPRVTATKDPAACVAEAQTACNALDACSGFSVSTGEFDDPVWAAQAAAEAAAAAEARPRPRRRPRRRRRSGGGAGCRKERRGGSKPNPQASTAAWSSTKTFEKQAHCFGDHHFNSYWKSMKDYEFDVRFMYQGTGFAGIIVRAEQGDVNAPSTRVPASEVEFEDMPAAEDFVDAGASAVCRLGDAAGRVHRLLRRGGPGDVFRQRGFGVVRPGRRRLGPASLAPVRAAGLRLGGRARAGGDNPGPALNDPANAVGTCFVDGARVGDDGLFADAQCGEACVQQKCLADANCTAYSRVPPAVPGGDPRWALHAGDVEGTTPWPGYGDAAASRDASRKCGGLFTKSADWDDERFPEFLERIESGTVSPTCLAARAGAAGPACDAHNLCAQPADWDAQARGAWDVHAVLRAGRALRGDGRRRPVRVQAEETLAPGPCVGQSAR